MAASTAQRNLNAYVEEYDSDQSEQPVLESFRRSPAANVAAKRSHPSDLGADKPVADGSTDTAVPIDLRSDSGYSSHTAGTMSSADSGPSAKFSQTSTAPSSAASMPPPSPHTSKRRPTVVEDRKRPTAESPRRPLQRTNSSASKPRPPPVRRPTITQKTEECRDPNCKTCGPNAPPPRRGRRESLALDSALDMSYNPPYDARSQRSDPSYTTSPPSPIYNRQPPPYMQGSTMIQPAQTRPRAFSTSRRPMSYHGNPAPDHYASGMPAPYPSPPQEYGPPLSMSAYPMHQQQQQQHQMAPFAMMGATPPSHFYQGSNLMAQHLTQTSPPYDQQRPPLSARTSSAYPARRPVSALVTHDSQPDQSALPSARYGNAPQPVRQDRYPPPKQLTQAQYDSESSSEYESEEEYLPVAPPPKQLMAPPKIKSKSRPDPRPILRKANTTQVTQVYNNRREQPERHERRPSVTQSQQLPERPRMKDTRAPRVSTAPPSRSISVSRPKAQRATQSAYDTPKARVIVENPRTSRRQSYLAYEQSYGRSYDQEYDDDETDSEEEEDFERERQEQRAHQARQRQLAERAERAEREKEERQRQLAEREKEERRHRRRSTQIYADGGDAIPVIESKSRRRTDASLGGNQTTKVMDDVEAYQQRIRGTQEPLSEQIHKVAKQRAARVPSDPDRKTRISQSAKTTVTNGNNNGEIRLRVDASAPLSLSFNGDMEGRTLQINPAEDGMADIVIGGQRGEDDVYHSEKGSVRAKRRSLIADSARRDAEVVSVQSGRSSQGRREREREAERRPLRRQATQTRYHY